MKAIRLILASIRNADNKYHLFHQGDKIVVGTTEVNYVERAK